MRTLFFCLLSLFVISCEESGESKKNTAGTALVTNSEKYQMEVFQTDENNFQIVCLNRQTGNVFIRNNNGSWYNAQDMKNLKQYKTPVYSMKIIKGSEDIFQVVLFNAQNANVYIRSYASSWYEASGVRALEN